MFSEMGQDAWVLRNVFSKLPEVENGFFVEFGARDGKEHSNSFYFEQIHGWRGLLVKKRCLYIPENTSGEYFFSAGGAS